MFLEALTALRALALAIRLWTDEFLEARFHLTLRVSNVAVAGAGGKVEFLTISH